MQKTPLERVRHIEGPLVTATRMCSAAFLVVAALESEDQIARDNAMALRAVLFAIADNVEKSQCSAGEWADDLMKSRAANG